MAIQRYHLGCPIWSNRDWAGRFFTAAARPGDFLSQYSSVFNTVEGNTTFYGLPKQDVVARWADEVAGDFRFCFKFPRAVSHMRRLREAATETELFLRRLEPLGEQLGPFFLQLPPEFGPAELAVLERYLASLPAEFHYAVEVRHPDFFTKGESEKALNRLLQEAGVDRVMLDSRALFSAEADDEYTLHAQRRKPKLPVHAVALGARPLLRFIGHPQLEANREFLEPWIGKVGEWIKEGRMPYVFIHTPDNRYAPELARVFHGMLDGWVTGEDIGELPQWPVEREVKSEQLGLF